MRRVKWNDAPQFKVDAGEGWFHQFSTDDVGNISAIVERDDGLVMDILVCNATGFTFIRPWKPPVFIERSGPDQLAAEIERESSEVAGWVHGCTMEDGVVDCLNCPGLPTCIYTDRQAIERAQAEVTDQEASMHGCTRSIAPADRGRDVCDPCTASEFCNDRIPF